MKPLQPIFNDDNRMVARFDPNTGTIEIKLKNCLTSIRIPPGVEIKVINQKTEK